MWRKLYVFILGFSMLMCQPNTEKNIDSYFLYVGAYTEHENEGITIYEFNADDGSLSYIKTIAGVINPSYLALNQKKKILIAANETVEYQGKQSGALSAFKIDPLSGDLAFMNQVSSEGGAPCYVTLTSDGAYALVANYVGGNYGVFPLENSGIQPASDVAQHTGSGVNPQRQEAPHAHAIVLDPEEKFALAVDLGIDKVVSYSLDKQEGRYTKTSEFNTKPGAGPRHIVFHKNGKLVFIINELNSTISSCHYDSGTGTLTEISTVNSLPSDFEGENSCADIHVSIDGHFLYGSNRGHDSIVAYAIDDAGSLTLIGHQSVQGKTPRNFTLDPTGKFLLVANQKTDNIVVFEIDNVSGKLQDTGISVNTPKPVCLTMMPRI